jgi:hypothetical protein
MKKMKYAMAPSCVFLLLAAAPADWWQAKQKLRAYGFYAYT